MSERFAPLAADGWGDAEYAALGVLLGLPGDKVPRAGSGERLDPLNVPVVGLLAHHPQLARAFLRFNGQLLFAGELPTRLRELAILRVALTLRSPYEYGEHVRIAMDSGVTADDVDSVADGNGSFAGADRLVLEATDELLSQHRMGDTWDALVAEIGTHAAIEVIFVVGTYSMLATALDTWGLPAAEDAAELPPPPR